MLQTTYKDITYSSERDLGTLETDIFYILEGKGNLVGFNYQRDFSSINEKLNLYNMGLGNYLIESKDQDFINSLKITLKKEGVDIIGSFERNGKMYLIVYKPKKDGIVDINIFSQIINNILES